MLSRAIFGSGLGRNSASQVAALPAERKMERYRRGHGVAQQRSEERGWRSMMGLLPMSCYTLAAVASASEAATAAEYGFCYRLQPSHCRPALAEPLSRPNGSYISLTGSLK